MATEPVRTHGGDVGDTSTSREVRLHGEPRPFFFLLQ